MGNLKAYAVWLKGQKTSSIMIIRAKDKLNAKGIFSSMWSALVEKIKAKRL